MSLIKCSLDSIDIDVLAAIFEYIDDESPHTTKSLALVNKSFNQITKLVGHRRKKLKYESFGDESEHGLLQKCIKDDQLIRGLRHLTLVTTHQPLKRTSTFQAPYDFDASRVGLTVFIEKLSNLKTLKWRMNVQLPLEVLEALHKHHPKAKLHVDNFTRINAARNHEDPAEIALSKSPALTFIRAVIWNQDRQNYFDFREAAIQRIIANAPNLRHASVIISGEHGVALPLLDEEDQIIKNQIALFHTHKKPNSSLRSLTLDGYTLDSGTLTCWSRFVDLSKLDAIKCSRGLPSASFFKEAPHLLTSLKTLRLNLASRILDSDDLHEAMKSYIENCPPLENISLWSWRCVIPLSTLINRHGQSLKSLQLHEREEIFKSFKTSLSVEDVRMIRESCPNLTNFTLDLYRRTRRLDVDDHKDMFAELAAFNLANLQIYYDLGAVAIERRSSHVIFPSASNYDLLEFSDKEDEEESGDDNDNDNEDEEVERSADLNNISDEEAEDKNSNVEKRKQAIRQIMYRANLRPSSYANIERYLQEVWKIIFGHKTIGPRALDVKFGEWERKTPQRINEFWSGQDGCVRTYWQIRPQERDDCKDKCWVHVKGNGWALDRWRETRTSLDIPQGVNVN